MKQRLTSFWNWINSDVSNVNEPKKTAVILRLFSIFMLAFFLIQSIPIGIAHGLALLLSSLACLFLYTAALYLSYHGHTKTALHLIFWLSLVWIIAYVFMFGWDCGYQHFLFILLVFDFFTSHRSVSGKLLIAALLCACRLFLYFYTQANPPLFPMSELTIAVFQLIGTVLVFLCLSMLALVFSQNSLAMEKKLLDHNQEMHMLASADPLTRLMNRRGIQEYMEELVRDGVSRNGYINIAIGDIDFFKRLNDSYGHEAGDFVLQSIADIFREHMQGKGCVARWGGEEFLFVFHGINGDHAFMELEKLRARVSHTKICYKGQELSVTITFGLAEHARKAELSKTLEEADQKLYLGKQKGRNRVVF